MRRPYDNCVGQRSLGERLVMCRYHQPWTVLAATLNLNQSMSVGLSIDRPLVNCWWRKCRADRPKLECRCAAAMRLARPLYQSIWFAGDIGHRIIPLPASVQTLRIDRRRQNRDLIAAIECIDVMAWKSPSGGNRCSSHWCPRTPMRMTAAVVKPSKFSAF